MAAFYMEIEARTLLSKKMTAKEQLVLDFV